MLQILSDWISGNLSPTARVWTALLPALLLVGYFIGGMIVYAIVSRVRGAYRDADIEKREATALTTLWMRQCFVWVMRPVWGPLIYSGLPASSITTLSLLLATGSGVAIAAGRFALGGWLYRFSGICDFLDGRLARARNESSQRGAALDSILDRYSDSVVLVGLAWYYRDTWVLFAALLALVGSSLIPYIRARAEASGIKLTVGLMQRAERILYLGASVTLSPIVEVMVNPNDPHPPHRLAIYGLVLMAISTQITALQRFIYLLRALGDAHGERSKQEVLARNLIAAFLATAADFAVVTLLVSRGWVKAPIGTGLGCFVGAVVNFTINRVWTFQSRAKKLPQAGRYAFVSVTSALLNAGGVAIMLFLPGMDYRIAWIAVRGLVFFAWNFPLQRDYVFADSLEVSEARAILSK